MLARQKRMKAEVAVSYGRQGCKWVVRMGVLQYEVSWMGCWLLL
jgi:hypothetical protein